MDELDRKILGLLTANGRMTVKDIAARIALTSPAVSERIKRLEKSGVIAGYTVLLGEAHTHAHVDALISVSIPPADRDSFLAMVEERPNVRQCFHVTGSYSYIVKVSCADMAELEHTINRFQKIGQTSTQIILSTPVERYLPAE